jgi:hypothetical protein
MYIIHRRVCVDVPGGRADPRRLVGPDAAHDPAWSPAPGVTWSVIRQELTVIPAKTSAHCELLIEVQQFLAETTW